MALREQQDEFKLNLFSCHERLQVDGFGKNKYEVKFDGKTYSQKRGEKFEPVALTDLLDRPQNLFAIGLTAIVAEQPFSNLAKPMIDGSGKARGRNAWRMEFAGGDHAKLFGWFKMYGPLGLPEPQLVKLAGDRDSVKGAVVFDEWEQTEDYWLPLESRVVSGLAETTVMSIQIDSVDGETGDKDKTAPKQDTDSKMTGSQKAEVKE